MKPLAAQFRAHARRSLSGYWGVPIGVVLVAGVIISASAAIWVGPIFLAGPLTLGLCMFFSRLVLGERPAFTTMFDRFEIFFKACGLLLFMELFVFLWSLLLVVPGYIAYYRYSMAPYLMAEYPDMGIREAVDRSKQLMDGQKGRLFCLHFSFIGWALLGMLTFGILYIWLVPYIQAAEAAFYMELTGKLNLLDGSGNPTGNSPDDFASGAETI